MYFLKENENKNKIQLRRVETITQSIRHVYL